MACRLARAHAYGIKPSRPPVEHSRSHSRTCRFNSTRTSAWIKRARRTWLHLAPPSLSHLDIASASSPFLSARHAITISPPSRGPWFTCIKVVPSVALSLTASNVHHVRPSCTPTRSRPELAQREHRHALHAVALHVVALHSSSSSFCCGSRARFDLAVP
jgi:hypothetical protein